MCTSFPTLLVSLPNLASILAGYIPLSWTNRLVSVNELLNSRGGRTLLFVVDETFLYMFLLYISLYIPIVWNIPIGFACIFSRVNPHGPWFFLWISGISSHFPSIFCFSRALGRRDGVDAPSELQRLEMSLQPRGSHLAMLAMVFSWIFISIYKWW